ncbi:MAG: molybdopterin synthase sulfur carrier subunit [Helicobacteraceae bacterium]|nr:molybdopterin synthase sulfur carrier subunit [Helicobacteraceae bacterium]
MVKVEFLGPIQKPSVELDASTLKEVSNILKQDSELTSWLENCAVAVNDTLTSSLDIELKDGDKISLLPPVCGG